MIAVRWCPLARVLGAALICGFSTPPLCPLTPTRKAAVQNSCTHFSFHRVSTDGKIILSKHSTRFPLLLLLHNLKAADDIPATFTSQKHSVVDEGNCTLKVHTRDGRSSRNVVSLESFANDTHTEDC